MLVRLPPARIRTRPPIKIVSSHLQGSVPRLQRVIPWALPRAGVGRPFGARKRLPMRRGGYDCQFALGFESADLRKNRRPQRQRPPPLARVAVQVSTSALTYSYLLRETETDTLSLDKRNTVG
jgi:hypothetical protein